MRLTAHVSDAKKDTHENKTKEGIVNVKKTFNTLSFSGVNPEDVGSILNKIKGEGLGEPTKHYLSNEKIPGQARGKRKV